MRLALVLALVCAPSHAAVIGVVQDGGDRLELHDHAGDLCLGTAKLAVYISDGKTTPGCWVDGGRSIGINWLDGDRGEIPKHLIRKPEDV